MKKFILTLSLLALSLGVSAQNDPVVGAQTDKLESDFDTINQQAPTWVKGGIGGVTLSQVSLSNWSAGGEGSMAVDAILNYDALYTNRRHLWQNRIEFAYGLSNTQALGTRKTNDKIFLSSMYGYRISKTWYASLLGTFSTQFAKGYDYSTTPRTYMSRFMSPGYLNVGAGFTWKPRAWFNAYFSPVSWRGTIVSDDRLFENGDGAMVNAPYGVEPGKHFRSELGANMRFELDKELMTNLKIYSRLDLFSNYLLKPQNVDVRWHVLLTAKVNKWVSANLSFDMLYDDDIKFTRADGTQGPSRLQVKEVLGLGLQTAF
jgi:hypothetical protein